MTNPLHWPGQRAYTTTSPNASLDFDTGVGIRSTTFEFFLVDGKSGENLGEITPYIANAVIQHDVSRIIKRQLTLALGVSDTDDINPLTDRIMPFMIVNGVRFPLGRYMFTDSDIAVSTGGNEANVQLVDEMFIVDQQIEQAFTAAPDTTSTTATLVEAAIFNVMEGLDIEFAMPESSSLPAIGTWGGGARRGQIIDALCTQGGYFSPWFGNDTKLHLIQAIDAATSIPTFDFDENKRVFMDTIRRRSNILDAPNRYIVISNANDTDDPIVGRYDVPSNAPHSITNRGFVIPSVQDIQLPIGTNASLVARSIGLRDTAVERIQFDTAPDPRHDSYDIITFEGAQWLEISWALNLVEGGAMRHVLQKAYT